MSIELIAPSASSTREALLAAAAERLQEVGWTSFSFRDLADRVGIRAASIHYHYPTKADLGVALVERMRDERLQHEQSLVVRFPDPRERLLALGSMIQEHVCTERKSCPIYALQAEYSVLPPALQRAVTAWIDDCVAGLARWLADGRAAGVLRFPGEPHLQALVVWAVLQQGTQLHRTHPTTDFMALVRQLVDSISA